MDWLVISIGTSTILGSMAALYFLPGWLRKGDVAWLVIVTSLLLASAVFVLSLLENVTQVSYEDRTIFILFWGGVLVALNGTIILKIPAGSLAPQVVDDE